MAPSLTPYRDSTSPRAGRTRFVNGVNGERRIFDVLGCRPILGRTFSPADDVRGGGPDGPVAVVSFNFWQHHFGGAADVIGKPISLDRIQFTVIGVTPPGFTGSIRGTTYDVAIPLAPSRSSVAPAKARWINATWWWLPHHREVETRRPLRPTLWWRCRTAQPQIPRGDTAARTPRPKNVAALSEGPFNLRPAANGTGNLGRQYREPLYVIMGSLRLVLLIRVRKHRQPAAGARECAPHELSVRVALGVPMAHRAAAARREPPPLGCGRLLGLAFARWGATLLVPRDFRRDPPITLDVGIDWLVLHSPRSSR
jgi:hypothetical protein